MKMGKKERLVVMSLAMAKIDCFPVIAWKEHEWNGKCNSNGP